jgi:hypothetical protein
VAGGQDASAEFHRVLVVRQGEIVQHHMMAGAGTHGEQDEEEDEAQDASRGVKRSQRRPASREPGTQPRRQAVSEQARRREQKHRVGEPQVEIARRAGILRGIERSGESRGRAPERHEGENEDVAGESGHQATRASVQRLGSLGEGDGVAAPR